jgi:hypothetical protein
MFHVASSLIGGLAVVAAWALVVPVDFASQQTDTDAAGWPAASVNRAAKADRLSFPPSYRRNESAVSTVEAIGIRDASIIYRARDGRVLFRTDPVSNVTLISKGFALPQLTVREMSHSKSIPIDVPRDLKALRVPIGCDPMASPVAQPELAHLTGRCVTQRDDAPARVSRAG